MPRLSGECYLIYDHVLLMSIWEWIAMQLCLLSCVFVDTWEAEVTDTSLITSWTSSPQAVWLWLPNRFLHAMLFTCTFFKCRLLISWLKILISFDLDIYLTYSMFVIFLPVQPSVTWLSHSLGDTNLRQSLFLLFLRFYIHIFPKLIILLHFHS